MSEKEVYQVGEVGLDTVMLISAAAVGVEIFTGRRLSLGSSVIDRLSYQSILKEPRTPS